jgi:HlyD family secretion protein
MEGQKNKLIDDLQALRIDRSASARPRIKRRQRLSVLLFAVAASALVLFAATRFDWASLPGRGATQVRVTVVAQRGGGGPQPILSAAGYVIARNKVEVGSKITGRIVSLEVEEGDFVQRGQIIARLDDQEVRAKINHALAGVAAARARLAELEAGPRPQELGRANAEVERAQADLRDAELNYRRSAQLASGGVVAQQEVDNARARYEMARAALHREQEQSDLTRAGARKETISLSRAQVKEAEAELSLAQAELENTIIRAPISGLVFARYVSLGEMVTTSFTSDRGAKQALVAVGDLNDLQVEMDISEADIAKVQLGQTATIIPDAYAERRYNGLVEYIASVADRQKATIKVKVRVQDPNEFLRPDMGVKVTCYAAGQSPPESQSALMLPGSAVVERQGRQVLFVVSGTKAVMRPVTVGRRDGGQVEILDGVQAGESVIISGHDRLNDGDEIAAQP